MKHSQIEAFVFADGSKGLHLIHPDDAETWHDSGGEYHNDGDRPAGIFPDGFYCYCRHGQYHRDNNLPARIFANGLCEWWVDGCKIKTKMCTSEEVVMYKLVHDDDIQATRWIQNEYNVMQRQQSAFSLKNLN